MKSFGSFLIATRRFDIVTIHTNEQVSRMMRRTMAEFLGTGKAGGDT